MLPWSETKHADTLTLMWGRVRLGAGTAMPSTTWRGRETGTILVSCWEPVLPFSGLSAPEGDDPTMVEHQIIEDLRFSTAY